MDCVHEEDRFQPFFLQTEDEESEPEAASLYQGMHTTIGNSVTHSVPAKA
jgi:hypothetical protein